MRLRIGLWGLLFVMIGCGQKKTVNNESVAESSLFTRLSSAQTGVTFINEVEDKPDFNIFKYRNLYNGGGVAIGDINNDGLPDVFFTANMKKNRL